MARKLDISILRLNLPPKCFLAPNRRKFFRQREDFPTILGQPKIFLSTPRYDVCWLCTLRLLRALP